jgi:hypothetical protein
MIRYRRFHRLLAGAGLAVLALSIVTRAPAAAPLRSDAEIRDSVRNVYARPEFSDSGPSLSQLIAKWIREYFGWLGQLSSSSPILFWVLLLGCISLLVVLTGHIAWTVRRALAANGRLSTSENVAAERERLSTHYWQEARERAAHNEFTEAIRCLFLSLVYRFDETGRVNFLSAYTNREYLALFADRPEVQSALGVFVDTLDDCWYGQRATDHAHYQDCLARYERLK